MKMHKLESKNYNEMLDTIAQKATIRLERYLKEPSEENVHDARTAIRRLESAWRVLPKKVRQKRKAKKFVNSYKKFFKINSKIRDFDIIQQRLGSLSTDIEKIKQVIYEKKEQKLLVAQKQAKKIHNFEFPKIMQDDVSPSGLEKRFKKLSIKLIENIQTLMPVVISSEENIDELHKLRKDCKKLRYLLELTSDAESSNFVARLKQMQDLLGEIHDSDITIDFLKKLPSNFDNAKDLLKIVSNTRSQLYKKFVDTHKTLSNQA
jgi:CHAD domain-containing protein